MKRISILDIDRAKRRKKKTKLVGVVLSKETFDYFTLYCLAEDTSKAEVMRELLLSHFNESVSTEELIRKVIRRALLVFDVLKKKKGISLDEFLTSLQKELMEREIDKAYIKVIIANVRKLSDGTNKTTEIESAGKKKSE